MTLMDLNTQLTNINKDFASKGIKLRIEKRGNKLSLRGPLPCPKAPTEIKNQRISLGLSSDHEGIFQAKKFAQLISLQLEHKQFNWDAWISKTTLKQEKSSNALIQEGINKFKAYFFSTPHKTKSPSSNQTNWDSSYKPYLRRLEEKANEKKCIFSKELFLETLLTYKKNTRSREQCGTVLNSLAKYLDIKLYDDWSQQCSGYGLHKAQFRELPSDDLIIKTIDRIPNPRWKLVFGLMATYGLRNHEVFFCDLSCLKDDGDRIIRVFPNTKTGEHQVWPFHAEWVDLFKLNKLSEGTKNLPIINTDLNTTTLQKVGRRVSEQFKRYNLPVTPYDLRHAWAIRTIHIGLPDTVSARMMGHSVSIHTRTYHHWITKRDQQQAVDNALSRIS